MGGRLKVVSFVDVAGGTRPIRVFLLDDHEVVREGVRHLLESSGEITVVGTAGRCREALDRIGATRPDVAVLDVALPDGSGVEVCRDIRVAHPQIGCLMLTSYADDDAMFQSVLAGAAGFVLKQVRGTDLVTAVRRVANGDSLLDPTMTRNLFERIRNPVATEDPRLASLTKLERSILDLVAEGKTNAQIGADLHLAEKTVKNYMSSILMKLGMSRRTEAAVFAVKSRETL